MQKQTTPTVHFFTDLNLNTDHLKVPCGMYSDVRNQPSLWFRSFKLHRINDGKTTGSPGDTVVKSLPARVGDQGLTSAWGGAPEKEMATRSSILAWTMPWMRSLVGYSPWGGKESDTT